MVFTLQNPCLAQIENILLMATITNTSDDIQSDFPGIYLSKIHITHQYIQQARLYILFNLKLSDFFLIIQFYQRCYTWTLKNEIVVNI